MRSLSLAGGGKNARGDGVSGIERGDRYTRRERWRRLLCNGLVSFMNGGGMRFGEGLGGYSTDPKKLQAEHVLAVHNYRHRGMARDDVEKNWANIKGSCVAMRNRWHGVVSEMCRFFKDDADSFLSTAEYLPASSAGLRCAASWNLESGAKKKYKEVYLFDSGDQLASAQGQGQAGLGTEMGGLKKTFLPLPMLLGYEEWKKGAVDLSATAGRFTLIQRQSKSGPMALAEAIADSLGGIDKEASAILVSNLCADNCALAREIYFSHFPDPHNHRSDLPPSMNTISECLSALSARRRALISEALENAVGMSFGMEGEYCSQIEREIGAVFFTKSLSSLKVGPPSDLSQAASSAMERREAVKEFKSRWPSVIAKIADWEREWLKTCGYVPIWEEGQTRTYKFDPFLLRGTVASRFHSLEEKLRELQNVDWSPLSDSSKLASTALAKAATYVLLKDLRHLLSTNATDALTRDFIVRNAKDKSTCANAFAHLLCDIGFGSDIYFIVSSCYDINLIVYEDLNTCTLYTARDDFEKKQLAIVSRLPEDLGFAAVRLHTGGADLVTAPMTKVTTQSLRDSGYELPPRPQRPKWTLARPKTDFASTASRPGISLGAVNR